MTVIPNTHLAKSGNLSGPLEFLFGARLCVNYALDCKQAGSKVVNDVSYGWSYLLIGLR